MMPLDWGVIALYMVGMLAVGEYFARRTENVEDYLLGGRSMGALPVGLSLFASLLSTISYLAVPGEMIKHGPLVFADILIYPLVFIVVGYLLIPRFMRLHVTSAYEILESQLGLSVRLLGSCLFLAMRLLWMGVIVYATTSQVLVPLMKLPEWTTPLACIVLGLLTVTYSTMGGFKAVVITDAIQSLILLSSAILTLVIVSMTLGGVDRWLPTHWPSHWDTFQIGIDSHARTTVMSATLAGLSWWICMGGSDQIAIQRYLATRDAAAARRMLGISLLTTSVSIVVLALVGLALLAYFQAYPELMAPDTNVNQNADGLFPRFVLIGFPAGISGLVIAGLLAAAMSSLSAGLSSTCLVIAVDFLGRFGRAVDDDAHRMRQIKTISWVVGVLTVLVSTLVGFIEGNLLELSFKVANLLTAPLFVLFFLAMFVPWSTPFGAWMATVAGVAVSLAIALGGFLGLSFLWITPVGLIVGVLTGCGMSLIPIGPRGKMKKVET